MIHRRSTSPAIERQAGRPKDALGRFGEALAVRHLRDDGFIILDRNWRCALGEIDIVARDAGTLVICEVKTRSSLRFGSGLEAITEAKLHRLQRLAGAWMRHRDIRVDRVRIDAVCILRPTNGPATIDHVRDLT